MRRLFVLVVLCALTLGVASLRPYYSSADDSVTKPIQTASSSPHRRALLVGISKYLRGSVERNKDFWDLNTENDVRLLKEILIRKFQFDEKDILVLDQPQQTTKKAILDAIRRHLIEPTQPGDIVFFHFSGHGQQIPDDGNDEVDGYDESLVPSDYVSQQDGSKNIRDDELGALLEELKKKRPANVTITFDSCYSGTATRGDVAVRGGPWMGAPPPKEKVRGEEKSASGLQEIAAGPAEGYVFLSAASPRQTAKETKNENDQPMGLFTWALVKALDAAGPRTTYRDLFERVSDTMTQVRGDQNPQLEGQLEKVLMEGIALKPERYISVKVDQRKNVFLQAGKLQGMTKGSRFALYPEGTKDTKEGAKLADAEIIETDLITSALKVSGTVAQEKLRTARAFETEHFFDDSLLKIAVQGLNTLAAGNEVLAGIGKFELAQTVERGKGNWDILIHTPTPADVKDKIVDAGFKGLILDRQSGSVLTVIPEGPAMAAAVRRALENEVRWLTIKKLENTDASLSIEIKLVAVDVELNASGRVTKIVGQPRPLRKTEGSVPELKIGDHFMIEVRNTGQEPAYVTILNLTSDGKVGPGWPQQIPGLPPQENRIKNDGEWVRIPEPYVFRVEGPAGLESFKAIATREPTDFTPLIDEELLRGQRGPNSLDARGQNAFNSTLGKLLLSSQQGRRSSIAGAAPPAWATASFNFLIRQ